MSTNPNVMHRVMTETSPKLLISTKQVTSYSLLNNKFSCAAPLRPHQNICRGNPSCFRRPARRCGDGATTFLLKLVVFYFGAPIPFCYQNTAQKITPEAFASEGNSAMKLTIDPQTSRTSVAQYVAHTQCLSFQPLWTSFRSMGLA